MDDQNRLWFQVYPNVKRPLQFGSHAGRDLSGRKRSDIIEMSNDCHEQGGGTEYGLVVNRKYLMFSCAGQDEAVFVYRNAPGRQSRVETIHIFGVGMTVGP